MRAHMVPASAHAERSETLACQANVTKEVHAQDLVFPNQFPDIEMLLRPVATMTGRTANSLVLDLAVINLNNSADLIKNQRNGVQEQGLIQYVGRRYVAIRAHGLNPVLSNFVRASPNQFLKTERSSFSLGRTLCINITCPLVGPRQLPRPVKERNQKALLAVDVENSRGANEVSIRLKRIGGDGPFERSRALLLKLWELDSRLPHAGGDTGNKKSRRSCSLVVIRKSRDILVTTNAHFHDRPGSITASCLTITTGRCHNWACFRICRAATTSNNKGHRDLPGADSGRIRRACRAASCPLSVPITPNPFSTSTSLSSDCGS